MKFTTLLTAVAASALMSGAAFAQATDQAPGPVNPSTSAAPAPAAEPAPPAPAAEPTPPAEPSATAPPTADTGAATSTSVTASDSATGASVTTTTTTNGPVPDTAENRAKYGGPMSHAGKRSAPKGN